MPGRDKTGPQGQGPMTGRGAGICAGNEQSEPIEAGGAGLGRERGGGGFGRGRGCGRGFGGGRGNGGKRGRGFGWGARTLANEAPAPAEESLDNLSARAEQLAAELGQIRQHIDKIAEKD